MNSIFKEYDIRGKYPSEINEEVCFEIGKRWAEILKSEIKKNPKINLLKNYKRIAIGRDMRKSSPELARAFSNGILSEGLGVDYFALASTPMINWIAARKEYLGGAIITASHNNSEYNGIKLCKSLAVPFSPKDLFKNRGTFLCGNEIDKQDTLPNGGSLSNDFADASKKPAFALTELRTGKQKLRRGKLRRKSYAEEYIEYIRGFFAENKKYLKIVVDAAWAMASEEVPFILDGFNPAGWRIDFIPLCFGPKEDFSDNDINPANPGALDDLSRHIKKYKADIGIAFDGDADRVFFMDEKGELIDPEIIAVILNLTPCPPCPKCYVYRCRRVSNKWRGKEIASPLHEANFVKQNEQAGEGLGVRLVLDSRSGRTSRDPLEKMGFKIIESRSGHTNIKNAMKKNKAAFGAETSGHYFFNIGKSGEYIPSDNAMIAMAKVLNFLAGLDMPISEKIKKYNKFYKSGEINFKVSNADKAITEIEEKFSGENYKKNYLDGITIESQNWKFNLRKSNTEDGVLRLNAESDNKEVLNNLIKKIQKALKE